MTFLFFALTFPMLAMATNGADEATFVNRSKKDGYCYFDGDDGKLAHARARPDESCQGDAFGFELLKGNVFKAPNGTTFTMNGAKIENDFWSGFKFNAASIKNGAANYGSMSFERFLKVMGIKR